MAKVKFLPPIGNSADRKAGRIWPIGWSLTNPFLNDYHLKDGTKMGCHTGVDLVKSGGSRGQLVFAIGPGKVIFAEPIPGSRTWGNVVVIYHGEIDDDGDGKTKPVFSRYAHLMALSVHKNDMVESDTKIGTVGSGPANSGMDPHLHFDISTTMVLFGSPPPLGPGNWPFAKSSVEANYVNPLIWLTQEHNLVKDALGKPGSASPQPVVTPTDASEEFWVVTVPTQIRQNMALNSPIAPLDIGACVQLKINAQEQIIDNSVWVQISDKDEFSPGEWVKKKDNRQTYLFKPP